MPFHLLQNRIHNAYQAQNARLVSLTRVDMNDCPLTLIAAPPPRLGTCGRTLHRGNLLRFIRSATRLALFKATSLRSYMRTTISPLSKTRTCLQSNGFRSHACRQRARSRVRANGLFASSSRWPRRSASSRKAKVPATRKTHHSSNRRKVVPMVLRVPMLRSRVCRNLLESSSSKRRRVRKMSQSQRKTKPTGLSG